MAKKFRVNFYLRGSYVSPDGTVPILIRLYLDRERIALGTTGCATAKAQWDSKACRVKSRTTNATYINNQLDRIEMDLNYIFRRLEFSPDLSLSAIKAQYLGETTEENCVSFTEFEQEYLAKIKKEVGINLCDKAYSRYVNSVTHFDNFIKTKYKKSNLLMKELTPAVIDGFVKYLFETLEIGQNTIMKKIQNIKTIVEHARKRGLITIDPFMDFKFRFKKSERHFLDEEEVNIIMKRDFGHGRLEFVRDMFVFSCFTGLAYVDLFKLTSDNLKMVGETLWIMTHRKKTDEPSRIPLLDIPKKIIAKYAGKTSDGTLFPDMSNQKINEYLKEIAEVCGIEQTLTFHVARHTFATMMISHGVPLETVSKMLGHAKITTTQIYGRIINKKIESDMLNIADKLKDLTLEGLDKTPSKRSRDAIVRPVELEEDKQEDSENAETPKRTTRNVKSRTSKKQDEPEATMPVVRDTTPKRRPGRPKKSEVVDAIPQKRVGRPKKEVPAPLPKRGPGRPKKDASTQSTKRKVGRPKKQGGS